MRQQRWSEPLQNHPDEREGPPSADPGRAAARGSRSGLLAALALIAAAVIVAVLAAAL
jgi:hypothetical protein